MPEPLGNWRGAMEVKESYLSPYKTGSRAVDAELTFKIDRANGRCTGRYLCRNVITSGARVIRVCD